MLWPSQRDCDGRCALLCCWWLGLQQHLASYAARSIVTSAGDCEFVKKQLLSDEEGGSEMWGKAHASITPFASTLMRVRGQVM